MPSPSRGEVWFVDFGHPFGRRPCLIVSDDNFNHGPAGLTIAIPITSVDKRIPSHVEVRPPEGGLKDRSFIKCEDIRSIPQDWLIKPFGTVGLNTLSAVGYRLRLLLKLN